MQSFSGVFIATHTVRPQVVVESTCEWKKSNKKNPMQCPSSSSRAIWMAFPYYVNLSRPFPINTQKLPSRRSDGRLQHGSRILSPELPIYSLFACTLNVHEIGEPEVAKGSSSQFFAIHRRFTVAVVVVVVINWSLLSPQPATCEFRKMTVRLPRWGVSSFRWFHCVTHLCAELPSCRLIHGIYFIRRLCTLLAIIRCTFLCCARSTSRPVQWPVDTVVEHNFIHNVEDEKWRSVVRLSVMAMAWEYLTPFALFFPCNFLWCLWVLCKIDASVLVCSTPTAERLYTICTVYGAKKWLNPVRKAIVDDHMIRSSVCVFECVQTGWTIRWRSAWEKVGWREGGRKR